MTESNTHPTLEEIMAEIERLEGKNGGPINVNLHKQVASLTVELGKLNENLLKAEHFKQKSPENFQNFFKGLSNQAVKVAARAAMVHDYLGRNFTRDGKPVDKTGE